MLIKSCKDEKNPRSPVARLLQGKDERHNEQLSEARQKVEDLIRLADDAMVANQRADDGPPVQSKPYDKEYYGTLANINAFKKQGLQQTK